MKSMRLTVIIFGLAGLNLVLWSNMLVTAAPHREYQTSHNRNKYEVRKEHGTKMMAMARRNKHEDWKGNRRYPQYGLHHLKNRMKASDPATIPHQDTKEINRMKLLHYRNQLKHHMQHKGSNSFSSSYRRREQKMKDWEEKKQQQLKAYQQRKMMHKMTQGDKWNAFKKREHERRLQYGKLKMKGGHSKDHGLYKKGYHYSPKGWMTAEKMRMRKIYKKGKDNKVYHKGRQDHAAK